MNADRKLTGVKARCEQFGEEPNLTASNKDWKPTDPRLKSWLEILTRDPDLSSHLKSWFDVVFLVFSDITHTQCSRSCASCRESFAHCSKSTGVCQSNCRRTKLCKRNNDLCLATWRWRNNRVVMFTSCFRLPPFSNSSHYNSKCQATVLNGTRTCLCQGTDCNRKPIEPVKEDWKQALSSENPKLLRQKRKYCTLLPSVFQASVPLLIINFVITLSK